MKNSVLCTRLCICVIYFLSHSSFLWEFLHLKKKIGILGEVYLLLKYYISVEDFFFKGDSVDWTHTVQANSFK